MEKRPEGQSVHSVIKAYIEQLEEKDKALSDANKEIERLKGLIEKAYKEFSGYATDKTELKWQQFKTANNL